MRQDPAVSEQNPPATPLDETTPAVPPLLPAHVTQGTVVKMNVANSTAAVWGCLCSRDCCAIYFFCWTLKMIIELRVAANSFDMFLNSLELSRHSGGLCQP